MISLLQAAQLSSDERQTVAELSAEMARLSQEINCAQSFAQVLQELASSSFEDCNLSTAVASDMKMGYVRGLSRTGDEERDAWQ